MNRLRRSIIAAALLTGSHASAVEIRIDYRYDTHGFFSNPDARTAIEAAARFFSDILDDTLLAVDPTEFPGDTWTVSFWNPSDPFGSTRTEITDLAVPENVIIIFVGSDDLGGSLGLGGPAGYSSFGSSTWNSRVRSRGNPGADFPNEQKSLRTDFAPAVGTISFNRTSSFNFSLTNPALPGADFLPIALHELGHVLGIGTADSWDNQVSSLQFDGPASVLAAGTAPSVTADAGHFAQAQPAEPAYGSFSTPHETSLAPLMVPTLSPSATWLHVATDLDIAALADIGWEIRSPRLTPITLGPAGTSFSWPSSSVFNHTLERSTSLDFASATLIPFSGHGGLKSWADPAPPANQAFYRLRSEVHGGPPAPALAPAGIALESVGLTTISQEPRIVTGCGCPHAAATGD